VIQRSEFEFDEPVDRDFTATSTLPAPADWQRFVTTLQRRRRARVSVRGAIQSAAGTGGRFEGVYVAIRLDPGGGS
jgi:thioesterase domain-containing protein